MVKSYAQVVKNTEEELPIQIQYFPIEIWILIWKKTFSSFVLQELKKQESVWCPKKKQSKQLKRICSEDVGAIQFGYTDFDRLVDKHHKKEILGFRRKRQIHDECLNGDCLNCLRYGFPCINLTSIGLSDNRYKFPCIDLSDNVSYEELWKIT